MLPLVLDSGKSIRLLLEVPVRIPASVYDLAKDEEQFRGRFAPSDLDAYLQERHDVDLYGNASRWATRASGVGKERIPVHVFRFDLDGKLAADGAQADQVTIEFKTPRGNFFTASALYYDVQPFKPEPVRYLRQGTPANLRLEMEWLDLLPETGDSNQRTISGDATPNSAPK